MSHIRFNHVFFSLMFFAALAVFVIPQRISSVAQAQLQFLFTPIARPMNALASWTHERIKPSRLRDDASPDSPRTPEALIRENSDLRMQLSTITAQLDQLKELAADRQRLGPLRDRCVPVGVDFSDAGVRESLSLSAGSNDGLREKMVVICPEGLVGRLTQIGLNKSRVQLISDKGIRITVSFARFEKDAAGATSFKVISYPASVAIALGDGKMIIRNRAWEELKSHIKPNDWAILDDGDWPRPVQNYRVARVSNVVQQTATPAFGDMQLESVIDLNLLKEVMVVTK